MKKFLEEFKAFISKGNVLDMAVGIIIGSAFTSIVNSLVSDIISPILGLFGTSNLDTMTLVLKASTDSEDAVTLNYGSFISAVINFLIMALILFCLVKGMAAMQEQMKKAAGKDEKKEPEKPKTKMCPYCRSNDLALEATRCPHCTAEIPADETAVPKVEAGPAPAAIPAK